jgi:glycerol-3-phosphate cytidylyltransferase-like family protein
MKITKRQLKRIIKEEKAKLKNESLDQYRASYHADGMERSVRAESELEKAIFGMLGELKRTQGYSDAEASETVRAIVDEILGM